MRFAEILNQPARVILINLSRAHLKTEARSLFGALLFTKFHLAMLLREHNPESQRLVTIAFVDEFAEIFCESFLDILVGGRKYKTLLALYLQSLAGQLEPEDVDIILGNAGVRCTFRVGRVDAERLAREFFNFSGTKIKHQERDLFGPKGSPIFYSVQDQVEHSISELTTQQVRELYISMKGLYDEPFIATTLPVEYPIVRPEWEEALREYSASKYNKSQAEIEAELKERKERIEAAMREANAEPSSNAFSKPIRSIHPRRNKR